MLHASLAPVALAALSGLYVPVFAQPVIITQPKWQTNVVGSAATFSVEATGVPPLAYQWRFNNANRAGATESTLIIPNVQSANQGNYLVVVSNFDGSVTSAVARLYVLVPPSITTQPANQFVGVGGTASFSVGVAGTSPLSYQWHFNESALVGKTNPSLSLINVQLTNAGPYSVRVTNLFGSVTSRSATLDIPRVRAFSRIAALSNLTVALHVTGRVDSAYQNYFELFPLEDSTNLLQWAAMTTLLRTNANTNDLIWIDQVAANLDQRFFRVFPQHLYTPTVKPTGPYPVGRLSLLLNDPSRTNRYNVPTNSSFMVSYWYPAEAEAGELPGLWEDRPLALDPNFWGSWTDRVPRFVAHSLPSASISTAQPKYPVIIYVPGYSGTRAENQEKFEDLASHGYIVISADHWEVYGTVFPDGTYLHGSSLYEPSSMVTNPVFAAKVFGRRMQDLRIMLADLDRANAGDSVLAERIDTSNIGLMGFSFGGGVVGEMCRTNDTCRAVVFMDSGGQGADELVRVGLQKPYLLMASMPDSRYQSFFDKATNNAVWFVLSNTVHGSFVYGYEVVNPSPMNREAEFTMKAYILSFFNKYLKSQDDHLLDGPSTNFPRVINFMRK